MDQTSTPETQPGPSVPAPSASTGLISFGDLFQQAYKRTVSYYRKFLPVLIAMFVATVAMVLTVFSGQPAVSFIIGIVAVVVYVIAAIALIRIMADLEPGGASAPGFVSRSANQVLPYIWVSLLVGLMTLGGIVLFIIPGIIISVFLSQATYVLIVEDKRGQKALIESWNYIKGRWWGAFGRMLVLMILVGAVTGLIGSLVGAALPGDSTTLTPSGLNQASEKDLLAQTITQFFQIFLLTPFTVSYLYLLYRSLKETKRVDAEEQGTRTWLTVFLVLGIIALIAVPIVAFTFLAFIISQLNSGGADIFREGLNATSTLQNILTQ